MVKKINKVDKSKYQTKNNTSLYVIAGLAIILVISIGVYLSSGLGNSVEALIGPAPSGNVCPENVAYIQLGVDKYKEVYGEFPTDVKQLTESIDGTQVAERIPPCPGGNLYIIDNGVVKEVAPQR